MKRPAMRITWHSDWQLRHQTAVLKHVYLQVLGASNENGKESRVEAGARQQPPADAHAAL